MTEHAIDTVVKNGVASTAAALAAGDISAVALTQHCLAQIQRHDPALNAISYTSHAAALARAEALDAKRVAGELAGPLHGVPLAIKDNIAVSGMPHTAGIKAYADRIADRNAPTIDALLNAGAIILAKSTLHEGALGATNDNPWTGRTHHPMAHNVTPGGSSGGSAVAVAAAMVPGALGSDTLGSVRVPSAYCGLVGFKPSNGRISDEGVTPLDPALDTAGPISRTVTDSAMLFASMQTSRLNTSSSDDSRPPRVACVTDFGALEFEIDVLQAWQHGVDALKASNLSLTPASLDPLDLAKLRRAGFTLAQRGAIAHHQSTMARNPDGFSANFHRAREWVNRLNPARISEGRRLQGGVVAYFDRLFGKVDALIVPTTPQTAFNFDDPVPASQADLTALANLAGLPAITIPLPVEDGYPVGLQVMAKAGDDEALLEIAAEIELRLHPDRQSQ